MLLRALFKLFLRFLVYLVYDYSNKVIENNNVYLKMYVYMCLMTLFFSSASINIFLQGE